MGQHPFEEDKSVATTKIVAHQYVCIRALEAALLRITEGFTPDVAYRVSSVDLTGKVIQEEHKLKGKVMKFSTYVDEKKKFEAAFSCTIKLWKVLGIWHPITMDLRLGNQWYTALFQVSSTYNMIITQLTKC